RAVPRRLLGARVVPRDRCRVRLVLPVHAAVEEAGRVGVDLPTSGDSPLLGYSFVRRAGQMRTARRYAASMLASSPRILAHAARSSIALPFPFPRRWRRGTRERDADSACSCAGPSGRVAPYRRRSTVWM